MSKTSIAKYIIRMTAVFIMSIQIILGMVWMAKNIMCIPTFGDSTEYIELSKSLVLDEYRPILYPLILRIFFKIENFVHIPFQINLYLFQTAVSFISIFCSVNSIDYYMLDYGVCTWKRRRIQLFISMYLWTIPMITFMNFSVLTDSLATSVLILLLTNLIKISLEENVSVGTYFVIVITLLIESLLRADRLYSCIFVLIFTFIRKMINIPKIRKKTFLSLLTISFIVVGTVHQIGHLTQIPGVYGRVETNFDFILLDRIVWSNMEKNYEFFSDEVKTLISIDDAKTFDSHNNNVMYQMAPLIESKVGKQKAKKNLSRNGSYGI